MPILLLLALFAADLPRGQVIDKVVCRAGEPHSYALYLPSSYTPERAWPILYCLDPGARGRIPAGLFREAAETYGYIVAGSNTSRNGPWEPNIAAFHALWSDTVERFPIDRRRIYVAGFSGGARAAAAYALGEPIITAVIGCGAGFPGPVPKVVTFAWFGIAGRDDFNYNDVRRVHDTLAERGLAARFLAFPGAHDWPPASACTDAIEWMELHAMKTGRRPRDPALLKTLLEKRLAAIRGGEAGAAYFGYTSLAADFQGLADVTAYEQEASRAKGSRELKSWRKREEDERRNEQALFEEIESAVQDRDFGRVSARIRSLQKKATAAEDSGDRRIARRVLSGEYVGRIEQLRGLSGAGQDERIKFLKEVIAALRPAIKWWRP